LAALEAIGEVGGPEARRVLEEALGEAEERIRIAAAHGLGTIGADAAPALERALHDPVRGVREAAGLGLGLAWQKKPLEELGAKLGADDDADLRYAAALALARRGGGSEGQAVLALIDKVARAASPAARLAGKLTKAYLGHPDEMAQFLRVLRDGT
jgi:HEAT repeat protein